jgi:MFS family permease
MSTARLATLLCIGEILSMASFATWPGLVPEFMDMWSLSATDAGWIAGMYFAGYVVGAPILSGLTDRIDARQVYIWSSVLTALSALAFAYWAEGFWTAVLFRTITGFGLAGTYMPGLKALSDRIEGSKQSRAVAFYTASFGVGASLSYFVTGALFAAAGWQWAVAAGAAGSAASLIVVALTLKPAKPAHGDETDRYFFDFRPVLANRQALGFTLAYSVHNWELFAFRSWIVAFLAFAYARQSDVATWWNVATIAALVNLIGWAASVSGNEAALKWGRRRVISVVMWASAALACLFGFTTGWPFWIIVVLAVFYGATIAGESAAVTAGVIAAAKQGQRGATMAMHATIGFIGSTIGPIAFGYTLDMAGGPDDATAWGVAFATTGAAVALGPVAIWYLGRKRSGKA